MKYEIFSHRHAIEIAKNNSDYKSEFEEIIKVLDFISDEDIINEFKKSKYSNNKSISRCINQLIKDALIKLNWKDESPIFQDERYSNNRFRLDFAKEKFSVEVAFNHGEAISWNLLKPVLSGELNHIKKAIQTKIGVIIFATDGMKKTGGFDGAVGSYEKALRYLNIMMNQLTTPLIIIGLSEPETFCINKGELIKNSFI
tara:strand:- start:4708 stop:5307 length:600 start_codon:yes stop_codon:yes gene_type:complete